MSPQPRSTDGHYFIVVDGVPPYCQWQELKDYLRESVKVNPAGYADVLRINEDGTRVGYCGLRSKTDANKAFDFLVAEGWRGLTIRVTIAWKSDLRSEAIERRRGPEASVRKRSTNSTPALPSFPSSTSASARSVTKPGHGTYNMQSVRQALPTQALPMQPVRSMYEPCRRGFQTPNIDTYPQPAYKSLDTVCNVPNHSQLSSGPPLQSTLLLSREDRMYTHQQAIHMSRLPHDIKTNDLKIILSRFGDVSDIAIKRGKEKRCSATAKFSKSSEAMLAIQGLHGKRWDKLNLVVRFDRSEAGSVSSAPSTTSKGSDDSDTSSPRLALAKTADPHQGPLVVDGACGPGYQRKKSRTEDNESRMDSSGEDESTISRKKAMVKTASRKTSSRVLSR